MVSDLNIYRNPQFSIFGYGLDIEFMEKFRIRSVLQNIHIRTPLLHSGQTGVGVIF